MQNGLKKLDDNLGILDTNRCIFEIEQKILRSGIDGLARGMSMANAADRWKPTPYMAPTPGGIPDDDVKTTPPAPDDVPNVNPISGTNSSSMHTVRIDNHANLEITHENSCTTVVIQGSKDSVTCSTSSP